MALTETKPTEQVGALGLPQGIVILRVVPPTTIDTAMGPTDPVVERWSQEPQRIEVLEITITILEEVVLVIPQTVVPTVDLIEVLAITPIVGPVEVLLEVRQEEVPVVLERCEVLAEVPDLLVPLHPVEVVEEIIKSTKPFFKFTYCYDKIYYVHSNSLVHCW